MGRGPPAFLDGCIVRSDRLTRSGGRHDKSSYVAQGRRAGERVAFQLIRVAGTLLLHPCGVMEWSAPPLGEWRPAIQEERHMTQPVIVGIDLGKNWFHLVGLDDAGAAVFRKKMNRSQLAQFAATAPRCIVATESCPGSQVPGPRVYRGARGPASAGAICKALPKKQQERFQRCGGDRRSGWSGEHALCAL